jgi:hypothetical protein
MLSIIENKTKFTLSQVEHTAECNYCEAMQNQAEQLKHMITKGTDSS